MVLTSLKRNSSVRLRYALLSNFIACAQPLCMSSYLLMQKIFIYNAPDNDPRSLRWFDRPLSTTAWAYCSGAITLWLVAIPYGYWAPEIFSFPASATIPLLYAVFIASALCYSLITYANRILSATITTSFWPLQVPIAALLSHYFYDQRMTSVEIFCGSLIIFGMLIVSWGTSSAGSSAYVAVPTCPDDFGIELDANLNFTARSHASNSCREFRPSTSADDGTWAQSNPLGLSTTANCAVFL